jgi:hypothetical protein
VESTNVRASRESFRYFVIVFVLSGMCGTSNPGLRENVCLQGQVVSQGDEGYQDFSFVRNQGNDGFYRLNNPEQFKRLSL